MVMKRLVWIEYIKKAHSLERYNVK